MFYLLFLDLSQDLNKEMFANTLHTQTVTDVHQKGPVETFGRGRDKLSVPFEADQSDCYTPGGASW